MSNIILIWGSFTFESILLQSVLPTYCSLLSAAVAYDYNAYPLECPEKSLS